MINLDSAILFMTKDADVKYLVNSEIEKCIQFTGKAMGNSRMEIWMNPSCTALIKIVYYTEKTEGESKILSKVSVKYNNVKLNVNIPTEMFSEKKYIEKKLKGIALTKDFSHYELVNESELTPQ